jgi:hypothetical protein
LRQASRRLARSSAPISAPLTSSTREMSTATPAGGSDVPCRMSRSISPGGAASHDASDDDEPRSAGHPGGCDYLVHRRAFDPPPVTQRYEPGHVDGVRT